MPQTRRQFLRTTALGNWSDGDNNANFHAYSGMDCMIM
jgi:hypothetical protein